MIIDTPFQLLDVLGTDEYKDVSKIDKRKHFFIINRLLSRAFPDVSLFLSNKLISNDIALDFWNYILNKQIKNSIKSLLFVKMASEVKNNKYNTETVSEFLKLTKINKKELNILIKYYKDDLDLTLKNLEKTLNQLQ